MKETLIYSSSSKEHCDDHIYLSSEASHRTKNLNIAHYAYYLLFRDLLIAKE